MGNISAITMPKFGLAMTEGQIASWAKQEGDAVKVGEELADVETSKITNAYESPVAGVLRKHVAALAEDLPVGSLIAVVADADVSDADIEKFISEFVFEAPEGDGEGDGKVEQKKVEIDARAIRYLETGTAHDGAPVVLIHGFSGDGSNWLFNQDALSAEHRVIAIDLPGHGNSAKQVDDPSLAGLSAVLRKVLAALGIDRAHLVGHSLGGGIALQTALDDPKSVASLTLIAPAALGNTVSERFVSGIVTAAKRKELQPVLELLFADKSLVSRDMIEGMLRYKRVDGATDALAAIGAANLPQGSQLTVLRTRLDELASIPAQVIWGENDEILSVQDADGLPERIAVHRLPKTGHMPHLERAGDVNRLVQGFLADVDAHAPA